MRVPRADRTVWVDGRAVPGDRAVLPLGVPELLSGVGAFETVSVDAGRPVDVERHLARLAFGAGRLDMEPPDDAALRAAIDDVAGQEATSPAGWMKIVVLRGGHWAVFGGPREPAPVPGLPATAALLPWRRCSRGPLTGVKTLSYAANVAGLEWARGRGADEGLWLSERGRLIEGCSSNVFVVRGRALFTPALGEGPLPGVVRSRVLEAARALGFAAHEQRVSVKRLRHAGEAFITSTLGGVRPLVRVDDRPVGGGEPGPATRRIAHETARLRGLEADPSSTVAGRRTTAT